MSQLGVETWSAARWQFVLLSVWRYLDELLGARAPSFKSDLFFLLGELSTPGTTPRARAAFSSGIWRLIEAEPALLQAVVDADRAVAFSEAAGFGPGDRAHSERRPNGQARVNRFRTVPIWYLTDRSPLAPSDRIQRYGSKAGGRLRAGKAEVTIPATHTRGVVERPGRFLGIFELAEDSARHVVLQSAREMTAADWMGDLRAVVGRGLAVGTSRDILVFVHGYNTTFDGALVRAAQLADDVQFDGPAVAYAWSSKGRVPLYTADGAAADDSIPLLEAALADLLRNSGARRVHVIAHSMGNRILIDAIRRVAARPLPKSASELREVIFAAPDVGVRRFTDLIGDYFTELHKAFNRGKQPSRAPRLTLYVSGNDRALGLSRTAFINDLERAGDSRNGLVVVPPLETVDVTQAIVSRDTHSYFVSNKDVLTDLISVLRGRAPAERPNLDVANAPAGAYWTVRR